MRKPRRRNWPNSAHYSGAVSRLRLLGFLLESATERLVPGLGSGNADHFVLLVADIEVEVGKELGFREGIGRVDAEKGMLPGRFDAGLASDFDPTSDPHAIGDARI